MIITQKLLGLELNARSFRILKSETVYHIKLVSKLNLLVLSGNFPQIPVFLYSLSFLLLSPNIIPRFKHGICLFSRFARVLSIYRSSRHLIVLNSFSGETYPCPECTLRDWLSLCPALLSPVCLQLDSVLNLPLLSVASTPPSPARISILLPSTLELELPLSVST